jgi:hypothetical protein
LIGAPQIFDRILNLALGAWARAARLHGRVPRRYRRHAVGWLGALLLHVILLGAMVGIAPARQAGFGLSAETGGQAEAFSGLALSPLLVSLAPRGDLGRSSTALPAARPQTPTAGPRDVAARPAPTAPSDFSTSPRAGADGPASTASVEPEAIQAAPAAAAAVQGLSSQASLQGGDVEGEQNLLRQIARCLPADRRPVIAGATLTVRIDRSGALAAAPALDLSLAFTSRETIADANLVIQAALQCGPYASPGGDGADYALTPDFSFLKPQAVAAVDKEGEHHGR